MIVLGHDQTVADWAGQRFGVVFHPPYVAWGTIDALGTLNGAVIFSDYVAGGNIEVTACGAGVFRRGVFREVCRYVFNHLGCARITARTRRDNVKMRRILPKGGFEFEFCQKRYYGPGRGDDALIFGMLRDGARKWMN